VTENTLYKITN